MALDDSALNFGVSQTSFDFFDFFLQFELRKIFDVYGLVYGVQVFPCQWSGKTATASESGKLWYYKVVPYISINYIDFTCPKYIHIYLSLCCHQY